VKFWHTSQRHRVGRRFAVAGLMLLLWVGAFALTVSPELHHLLHPDAQGPDHSCLITQLRQQPLLAGFVIIAAPSPTSILLAAACSAEIEFLPACDYRVSPSRAPPFHLSAPTVVG
jgi:hypothetical protein